MAAPKKRKREPPFDVTGIDFSVITTALKTGGRMIEQIINGIQYGSPEVRLLMMEECDFIIECRVCRGLFRALPNFIAHKRVYCCEAYCNYNPHTHFQPTATYTEPTVVVEPTDPEENVSHSSGRTSPTDSNRSERQSRESSTSREKDRSSNGQRSSKPGPNSNKPKGKTGSSQGKASTETGAKLSEDLGSGRSGTRTRSQLSNNTEDGTEQGLLLLKETVSRIEAGKLGHSKHYALLTGAADKMEREKRAEGNATGLSLTTIPTTRQAVHVSKDKAVEGEVTLEANSETSTSTASSVPNTLPVSQQDRDEETETQGNKSKIDKEPAKKSSENISKQAEGLNPAPQASKNAPTTSNPTPSDENTPSENSKAANGGKSISDVSTDVSQKPQTRIAKATLRTVTRVVRELRKKKEETSWKEQGESEEEAKSSQKHTAKVPPKEMPMPATSNSQPRPSGNAKRHDPEEQTQRQTSASAHKDQTTSKAETVSSVKDVGSGDKVMPKPVAVPSTFKPQLRQSARNAEANVSAERHKADQQTKRSDSPSISGTPAVSPGETKRSLSDKVIPKATTTATNPKPQVRQSARNLDGHASVVEEAMRHGRKSLTPKKQPASQGGARPSEKLTPTATTSEPQMRLSLRRTEITPLKDKASSNKETVSPKKNSSGSSSEKIVPQQASPPTTIVHQLRGAVIKAEVSTSLGKEEAPQEAQGQPSSSPRREESPSARSDGEDGNLRAVVKRCLTGRPWALRTGSVSRGSDAGSVSETDSQVDRAELPVVFVSPTQQDTDEEMRPALDLENLCCQLCNIKFSQKKSLAYHCQTHHSGTRTIYPCPYCKRVFYYFWGLTRHLNINHKKNPSDIDRMRKSLARRAFKQDISNICISVVRGPLTQSPEEQHAGQQKSRHSVPAKIAVAKSVQGASASPGQRTGAIAVEVDMPASMLSLLPQRRHRVEVIKPANLKSGKSADDYKIANFGTESLTSHKQAGAERLPRLLARLNTDSASRSKRILAKALRVTRSKRVYSLLEEPLSPPPDGQSRADSLPDFEGVAVVEQPSAENLEQESELSPKQPASAVSVPIFRPPTQTQQDKIPRTATIEVIVHKQKSTVLTSTAGSTFEPLLTCAGGTNHSTAVVSSASKGTVQDSFKHAVSTPQEKQGASANETSVRKEPVVIVLSRESHDRITAETSKSSAAGPGVASVNMAVSEAVVSQTNAKTVSTAVSNSDITTRASRDVSPKAPVTQPKPSAVASAPSARDRASHSTHLTRTRTSQPGNSTVGKDPSTHAGSRDTSQAHLTRGRNSLPSSPKPSANRPTPSSPGLLHICTGCHRVFGRKSSLISHMKICSRVKASQSASPQKRTGSLNTAGRTPRGQKAVIKDGANTRKDTHGRTDSQDSLGRRASSFGTNSRSTRETSTERSEQKQKPPQKSTTPRQSQTRQTSKEGAARSRSEQRSSKNVNSKGRSSRESSVESRTAGDTDVHAPGRAGERQSRSGVRLDSKAGSSRESSVESVRTRSSDVRPHLPPAEGRHRTASVSSSGSNRDRSVESRKKEATTHSKRKSDEDLLALSRKRLSEQLQQAAAVPDTKGKVAPPPKPQPLRVITTTVLRKNPREKLSDPSTSGDLSPQPLTEKAVISRSATTGSSHNKLQHSSESAVVGGSTKTISRSVRLRVSERAAIEKLAERTLSVPEKMTKVQLPQVPESDIIMKTLSAHLLRQSKFGGRVLRKAPSSPKKQPTVAEPGTPDRRPSSEAESAGTDKHKDQPVNIENTNLSKSVNSEAVEQPVETGKVVEMEGSDTVTVPEEEEHQQVDHQGEGASVSKEAMEEESRRPRRKRRAPSRLVDIGDSHEESDNDVTVPSKKVHLEPSVSLAQTSKDLSPKTAPTTELSPAAAQPDDTVAMVTEEKGGGAGATEEEDEASKLVEEIWMDKKPGRPTERVKSNRIYVVEPAHSGRLTCQDTRKVGQIVDESWLTCLQCDQKFTSVSNLRRHAIRHLGWRRFKCRLCRFCSYNRSECNTHIMRSHPERLRFSGSGGARIDTFITDLNRQAASVRSLKKRQTLDNRRRQGEEQSGGADTRQSSRRKLRRREGGGVEAVAGTSSSADKSSLDTPDIGTPNNSTPDNSTPNNSTPNNSTPDISVPDNSTPNTPDKGTTNTHGDSTSTNSSPSTTTTRSSAHRKSVTPASEDVSRSRRSVSTAFNISTRNSPRTFDTRPYPRPDTTATLNTRKGSYVKPDAPSLSHTGEEEATRSPSSSKDRQNDIELNKSASSSKERLSDIELKKSASSSKETLSDIESKRSLSNSKEKQTDTGVKEKLEVKVKNLGPNSQELGTCACEVSSEKGVDEIVVKSQTSDSEVSPSKGTGERVLKSHSSEMPSQKGIEQRVLKSHTSDVSSQKGADERVLKSHDRKAPKTRPEKSNTSDALTEEASKKSVSSCSATNTAKVATMKNVPVVSSSTKPGADLPAKNKGSEPESVTIPGLLESVDEGKVQKSSEKTEGEQNDTNSNNGDARVHKTRTQKAAEESPPEGKEHVGEKHAIDKTDDNLLKGQFEELKTLPKHFMSDDASPASVEMSEDN
ncbi:microtubule-associated protein futsch-like [Littorina saxatilis]|uniref:C2H2-type domain-containing protein n=1 Tax=Littorina saxatilis TaxID=31220 RepID=A0AAN9G1M2_9CAEN